MAIGENQAQSATGGCAHLEHAGQTGRVKGWGAGAAIQSLYNEILVWVEPGVNKSVDSQDLVYAEYGNVSQDCFSNCMVLGLQKEHVLNQTLGSLS